MYLHAVKRETYADLAGGGVLHSAPGYPGFPVRPAEEIFLRCAALLPPAPLTLSDPLCGSGSLVAVLGLRHRARIAHVAATDADPDAVALAHRNLDLLSEAGLRRREAVLRERAAAFGKPGYLDAADAAARLRAQLADSGGDLPYTCEVADVFTAEAKPADVVICDVPYGEQTQWRGSPPAEPVPALVERLVAFLPSPAVVAVVVPKASPVRWPFAPTQRLRLGRREARLFLV